jgi:hypothetical protein
MGDSVSRLTTKGKKGISEIYVPIAVKTYLQQHREPFMKLKV